MVRPLLRKGKRTNKAAVSSKHLLRFLVLTFLLYAALLLTNVASPAAHDIAGGLTSTTTIEKQQPNKLVAGRFPKYGSTDFTRQCPWATQSPSSANAAASCKIFILPEQYSKEGLSHWASKVASAYMLSRQIGCQLLFQYEIPDVDISQVLSSPVDNHNFSNNWEIPSGYRCEEESNCFVLNFAMIRKSKRRGSGIVNMEYQIPQMNTTFNVPNYRFAYTYSIKRNNSFLENSYKPLQKVLPGFQLKSGMACALGPLFELSTRAAQFEPSLFTEIIPKLQREDTLVIAVYIRTSHTESATRNGMTTISGRSDQSSLSKAKDTTDCVFSLEKQYLSGEIGPNNREYSHIVWMVISDSPDIKQWVKESYESANAFEFSNKRRIIEREVMVTRSQGMHTKATTTPSTTDFAEAMIDWYLIGESDFVVTGQVGFSSFGNTAALRTSRPIYHSEDSCSHPVLLC